MLARCFNSIRNCCHHCVKQSPIVGQYYHWWNTKKRVLSEEDNSWRSAEKGLLNKGICVVGPTQILCCILILVPCLALPRTGTMKKGTEQAVSKKIYSIKSDFRGLLHWAQMLLGSKSPIKFVLLLLDTQVKVVHCCWHLAEVEETCSDYETHLLI